MPQTHEGAIKSAAKNAGISVEEFLYNVHAGLKRCTDCKTWKEIAVFGKDASRSDGLKARCNPCASARGKALYQPVTIRRIPGPAPLSERAGDGRQARKRISLEVKAGRREHPNQLPCSECGHLWVEGERRHEYHHHKGYGYGAHADVIVLCTKCHWKAHHVKRDDDKLV